MLENITQGSPQVFLFKYLKKKFRKLLEFFQQIVTKYCKNMEKCELFW